MIPIPLIIVLLVLTIIGIILFITGVIGIMADAIKGWRRNRSVTEAIEIMVPTFEICANPTVKLSEIKARRFYIVDKDMYLDAYLVLKKMDKHIEKLEKLLAFDKNTT